MDEGELITKMHSDSHRFGSESELHFFGGQWLKLVVLEIKYDRTREKQEKRINRNVVICH